ncbi:MAG: TonB-dependent receptor [Odoribacteraceae bacterium]|nr:TonB-dependent receptor [Odoribacteraceae bacterium]
MLEEVIVRGRQARQEILPVQLLAGEELRRLGAYSVADAVRYFSGVQVKDYGGIGGLKTVNIRGMGSHHVGVFYDGIELGNAQNGAIDLGRFSLDNMEAVTLYNGQKSAILQTAKDRASASAIYMTARRPSFEASKRYNLNLAIKAGSFSTINPSILWEQRASERLSLSISAEYLYTSGKYKFSYARKNGYDTTETRQNGDVRASRAEAAIHGKINRGEWSAKLYYYYSERGYPGASVREEPGKFKHQDRQWDDNRFLQATLRLHPTARYSLAANAKYARDYLHYLSDPRLDVTTMYVNNHYLQQEAYLSLAHLFSISPRLDVSLANDMQYNTLSADLVDFARPDRYQLLSAATLSIEINRLKLQAGILHVLVSDKARGNANTATKHLFSPSIVASLEARPGVTTRAFYKQSSRLPTFNDMYYTFIGNKELQPEHTAQLNAGVTITRRLRGILLDARVDAYLNRVKNKIIAMPTSNQFRWTMINFGRVDIRGVDLSARLLSRLGEIEIAPRVTYSYQRARDLSDPGSQWYGGQIPYIPRHAASLVAGCAYRSWSFNYSFIYTGERYESVANTPENHAQPWYTHDAGISWTTRAGRAAARLTAEVNNLLDQQYEVVRCYPMPGTSIKIKLNISL